MVQTTGDLLTSALTTEPQSPSGHTNIIRGFVPANVTVKSCSALPDSDGGKPICGLGMTKSLLSCLTFL